jgi:hypothetical protein
MAASQDRIVTAETVNLGNPRLLALASAGYVG